jgi:hypothetical protein
VATPALPLLVSEPWRALHEYARLLRRRGREADAPGDGHAVIRFPGQASDARSLMPTREYCRRLGCDAIDWGRGLNRGPGHDVAAGLAAVVLHVQRQVAERPSAAAAAAPSSGKPAYTM